MNSRMRLSVLAAFALASVSLSAGLYAADTQKKMGFFVTSAGSGKGADLGGLAGADKICQSLAQAAGAGSRTWHAYLSTSTFGGGKAVNARDRIGRGPWYNAKGVLIAANVDQIVIVVAAVPSFYEELINRDKASLDIFWLKDDSLEDSANLPSPDIIAQEIVDDLEAALEQFRLIANDLGSDTSEKVT